MYEDKKSKKLAVGAVVVMIIAVLGVLTLLTSMRTVDTGRIGVVTKFGEVTGRELDSGVSFVAPWGFNNVTEYDIKTLKEEQTATAATADLQDATANVVVNYRINRGSVNTLHRTVGETYKDILILPAIQSAFKTNTAKYTAVDLINKRGEVEADVTTDLRKRLEERGIIIEEVSLVNLEFSKDFTQAIEQRQVAQQNAEKAKFNLDQARLDAQSQDVQAQTLTDNYLKLKAIEKWNGELPKATGGNGTLFNIPIN